MASIIPNEGKIKALDRINALISETEIINEAMAEKESFRLVLSGRKKPLDIDESFSDKVTVILIKMQDNRVREVRSLAPKFGIELDDNDQKILGLRDQSACNTNDSNSLPVQF